MTAHAAPEIVPCDDNFSGRMNNEPCADCTHPLIAHTSDNVCCLCLAIAELREHISHELERLRRS